jgi:opacity protein-like surface antigen
VGCGQDGRFRPSLSLARDRLSAAALAGWVACLVCAIPALAEWRLTPEVRVTSGSETDLIIDPGVTGAMVPGGSFIELSPTFSARGWAGRAGFLNFGTFATLQRFLNDDRRQLYAQTLWGDLYQRFGKALRGRLSVAADYFDDSDRPDVRRFNEGVEAGLALVPRGWNVEIWTGANGRQYPNLTTIESMNRSVTYTETDWSGGVTLRAAPSGPLTVRGGGILRATWARDPFYDSRSWTVTGSADLRLMSSAFLTLSGSYQDRTFTDRSTADDRDKYWQLGAGLRFPVTGGLMVSVRYGYSMYTWPDGTDQDSRRLAVGLSYAWGPRGSESPPPRINLGPIIHERGSPIQQPGDAGTIRLRVEAADAGSVSVSGDFNGWDPVPLRSAGDGWWEIDLRLDPGSYEYAYVIDGVLITPPEAPITVDDGFGGRNGVLEVLPDGL